MTWIEIERIFNRSLRYSFSKKKLFFVFPVLMVCGLLIVFCRALGVGSGDWVMLSLTFLPVFLCSGVLLAAGVILSRAYHCEVKEQAFSYREIFSQTWELLIGISYLSLPFLLAYLLLWMIMGIFYLVRDLPGIGELLGSVLSFAPFLLVLGSLFLVFLNLFMLFFVTPQVALRSSIRLRIADHIFKRLKKNLFSNLFLFMVGLIPLFFIGGLLSLAAFMTGSNFLTSTEPLSVALQWFFVMVPFSALLAPIVVFFFNFALESFALMQRDVPEIGRS